MFIDTVLNFVCFMFENNYVAHAVEERFKERSELVLLKLVNNIIHCM